MFRRMLMHDSMDILTALVAVWCDQHQMKVTDLNIELVEDTDGYISIDRKLEDARRAG